MNLELFNLHATIEEKHWWFVARRRILGDLIRDLVPAGKQATIIDVGCGTGANIAALANDYTTVGIDTSAEAISFARKRFPTVEFIRGFAPKDLHNRASEASAYLLTDVLEHVPDDFSMLSALLAEARPGALFVITVPADMSLWSQHDVSFGHYRRYDERRFRAIWEGLPVTELLLSRYNSRLYPLVAAVRTMNRVLGRASGKSGTDFTLPPAPANRLLAELFHGEIGRLRRVMRGDVGAAYRHGVSLIAVLRRDPGHLPVRAKPPYLAHDPHIPASAV
jgi:SAM-dependent methyltransferase